MRPACLLLLSAMGMVLLGAAVAARAEGPPVVCDAPARQARVMRALVDIETSIDPCGGSAEVRALLRKFRACTVHRYQVCTDFQADRNSIDRPDGADADRVRTISWNPALRTPLERGCDGDPDAAVDRDPTASLLHEVAHAVQDCEGLDPGEHEFEAVRIENIYRRAKGLCQRTKYGDTPLPQRFRVVCDPGSCSCAPAAEPFGRRMVSADRGGVGMAGADNPSPAGVVPGDADRLQP